MISTALFVALLTTAAPPPACTKAVAVGDGAALHAGDPIPCAPALIVPPADAAALLRCRRVELPKCEADFQSAMDLAEVTRRLLQQRLAAAEYAAAHPPPPPPRRWYEHPAVWGGAGVVVGLAVGVGLALATR